MVKVIMPKMGDGMEEGTLLEWLKKDGDAVQASDVIGTIQTDKATLELESPGSGVLAGLLIQGGDTVPVGQPIAAILKEGEALPADWGAGAARAATQEIPVEEPVAASVASAPAAKEASGRVVASPLARKIAEEKGIDLAVVHGSGPGGRIVERDVRELDAESAPAAAAGETVKLSRLRKITAERTAQSKREAPHFYVTVEVDVEALQALRRQFADEGGAKLSVNDFVIKACAVALVEMPLVNGEYRGDSVVLHTEVNVGMAVALDDGLTVPVIHGADQLGVREIAERSRELAGKARENKLRPEELTGSTFGISNMGMLNVESFSAIINPPNAAIVAVATASKRVVVTEGGELAVRERMNLTGSFDHRVVDGAVGAKFMNLVRDLLQNPTRLLG